MCFLLVYLFFTRLPAVLIVSTVVCTYLPSCIQLLINRSMGAIKKGIEEEGNWTMTYFIYSLTCIGSGYVNDAKFKNIQTKKVKHASDEHRTTASSKRNAWESALVKACGNQMVAATMMFSDVHTQYSQRAINIVMKASLAWHENRAWFLRSCEHSEI